MLNVSKRPKVYIDRCWFWMKNAGVFPSTSPDKRKYHAFLMCGKTRGVNDMFNHKANKMFVKDIYVEVCWQRLSQLERCGNQLMNDEQESTLLPPACFLSFD